MILREICTKKQKMLTVEQLSGPKRALLWSGERGTQS